MIRTCDPAAAVILGFSSAAELLAANWELTCPTRENSPADVSTFRASIRAAAAFQMELQVATLGGGSRLVSLSAWPSPAEDAEGRMEMLLVPLSARANRLLQFTQAVGGSVWNGQLIPPRGGSDAAEQPEQARRLELQLQFLQAAVEHAGLLYWEYTPSGKQALEEELAAVDCGGASMFAGNHIHPDDLPAFRAMLRRLDGGTYHEMLECRVLDPYSKAWVWVQLRYTKICRPDGSPLRVIATGEDIDAYKDLEQRFSTILSQQGIFSWKYDIGNRCILNSENVGGPPSPRRQTLAFLDENMIHPASLEDFHAMYDTIHQGEKHASCTISCWDEHIQTWVWFRIDYTTVYGRDGKPVSAIGSAIDVSTQMRLRKEYSDILLCHHQFLAPDELIAGHGNLTQNSMIEITDRTGSDLLEQFGYSWDGCLRGFAGYIPDEAERRTFLDLALREPLCQAYAKKYSQVEHICFLRLPRDFPGHYVRLLITLVSSPDTGDLMAVISVQDVTEERLAQLLLLRSVAVSYDFIMDIDLTADAYHLIASKVDDPSVPAESGSFTEAFSRLAKSYILPEDREHYCQCLNPANIREQLTKKPSFSFRFSLRDGGGVTRVKNVQLYYLEERLDRVCLTRTDATDIVRQEQAQRETLAAALSAAQQANAAKSDFLSRMSHDIRTPMNGIMGMTDLALADPADTAQVAESLSVIKSSSVHLLDLINNILDMSRIESGRMVLARDPFDLIQEIGSLVRRFALLAQNNQITFHSSINIRHRNCVGDPMRIRQILDNLIGNAIKFTPAGGSVWFEMTEGVQKNPWLVWYRLTVRDNGIGIAEESLKHLFEPFYRADNTSLGQTEGSGLGLPITKSIVDLKGGSLRAESELGKGSTFTVELPLHLSTADAALPPPTQATPSEKTLAGLHILLVEDHPVNQLVARRILEQAGATVVVGKDGKEGSNLFLKSSPGTFNAVLMDIQMPVMDGYESTRAIRNSSHPQAAAIPIIAMTANAFAGDVRRCLDAGMNAHLAKPIESARLYETLVQFCRPGGES